MASDSVFDEMETAAGAPPPARRGSQKSQAIDEAMADINTLAGGEYQPPTPWYKQTGRVAAGAADVILGFVPAAAATTAGLAARFSQPRLPTNLTPQQMFSEQRLREQQIERKRQEAYAAVGQYLPGQLAGVTETPEYKDELLQQISRRIGTAIGGPTEAAGQFYESLGLMPKEQVKSAVQTGLSLAVPPAVTGAVRGTVAATRAAAEGTQAAAAAAARGFKGAREEMRAARAERAATEAGQPTPADIKAQFEEARARSMGAAEVEPNPYLGKITGAEEGRGEFPQIKLSKTPADVSPAEQAVRSEIASEVFGETGQVRRGVITGNENTLRNEYAMAKSPERTPANELMKNQIANEQVALADYAQQRIVNTGADRRLRNSYERGERIADSFAGDEDSLRSFINSEKGKIYDEARETIGDNPIQSTNIDKLLNNKQFLSGLGLKNLKDAAKDIKELIEHAKTEGFEDEFGNFYAPNTINAFDAVKKSLNANWTKDNQSLIRRVNQTIDRDIAAAGGGNLLERADKLHQAEKTLFEAKGIKEVFGGMDANGIEQGIAYENIPKKLNSLKFNQWRHIYDLADQMSKGRLPFGSVDKKTGLPKYTLDIPPELQQAATNAKREMLGGLAREVYEAGATKAGEWNFNSVNDALNSPAINLKIAYAFPLAERQAFHKLNLAGYLAPGDAKYLGAGIETQRMSTLEANLPAVGAEVGAKVGKATGIPFVAAAGEKIGEKIQAKTLGRRRQKQAAELAEEMRRNAELGKTPINKLVP